MSLYLPSNLIELLEREEALAHPLHKNLDPERATVARRALLHNMIWDLVEKALTPLPRTREEMLDWLGSEAHTWAWLEGCLTEAVICDNWEIVTAISEVARTEAQWFAEVARERLPSLLP